MAWSQPKGFNYPLKRVLVGMENEDEINMGDEVTKFCVLWLTLRLIECPIWSFIQAWNYHRIPGPQGGIPNTLAQNSRITPLHTSLVPSISQAIVLHERSGSCVSTNSIYGYDPLVGHLHLQALRERDLLAAFPDMSVLFEGVLHGNAYLFKSCVWYFQQLTFNFSQLMC